MTPTTRVLDTDKIKGDLVAQLLLQHEQVRTAIDDVAATETPESRQQAFDRLRELLARHETGEQMIVRVLTRGIAGGDAIASARMDEENESKETLAKLEGLDIASVEFARLFETFAHAVLTHALSEEMHEFPLLLANLDRKKSEQAERQLLLAEKIAPTHPHPEVRSTMTNFVAGPLAAVADRTRDAIARMRSS